MTMRAAIESMLRARAISPAVRLLLAPLTVCSYAYGAAMTCRTALYRSGFFKAHRLGCAVVSVGNITVGGTGKTPTVCMLARWFSGRGIRTAVVTRGYRGTRTNAAPLVVSDGSDLCATAQEAGDEAVMLGRILPGVPVIACRNRVAAGRLACERFGAGLVMLDDGFQHLRLHRDVDIVLVNAADPIGNGFVLPRGTLREPLLALRRADIVLITNAALHPSGTSAVRSLLSSCTIAAPLFTASYRVAGLWDARTGGVIEPEALSGRKVAALCGIGDPEGFLRTLEGLGAQVVERAVYPDHHRYCSDDYRRIQSLCTRADAVVTTEKDIAKLDTTVLQTGTLTVLAVEQVVDEQDRFFQTVCDRAGL